MRFMGKTWARGGPLIDDKRMIYPSLMYSVLTLVPFSPSCCYWDRDSAAHRQLFELLSSSLCCSILLSCVYIVYLVRTIPEAPVLTLILSHLSAYNMINIDNVRHFMEKPSSKICSSVFFSEFKTLRYRQRS